MAPSVLGWGEEVVSVGSWFLAMLVWADSFLPRGWLFLPRVGQVLRSH